MWAHIRRSIYLQKIYFKQITIWNSADAAREIGKGYSRTAYLLVSLNSYSEVIIPINRLMIMYQGCLVKTNHK